mmetsp:Transcript_24433/g.77427  ORF Transcript_24433/g.77427 Transcript_24433/m.77427 type:complete len:469 (+) Transcript_24433:462-1868(+)
MKFVSFSKKVSVEQDGSLCVFKDRALAFIAVEGSALTSLTKAKGKQVIGLKLLQAKSTYVYVGAAPALKSATYFYDTSALMKGCIGFAKDGAQRIDGWPDGISMASRSFGIDEELDLIYDPESMSLELFAMRDGSLSQLARRIVTKLDKGLLFAVSGEKGTSFELRDARYCYSAIMRDMLASERQHREASATSFYFLLASKIRECSLERLPVMQDIKRSHPSWIVKKPIDMTSSLLGKYRKTMLGVSHRWEHPDEPDSKGAQLAALKRYLDDNPEIEHIWFDFSSMPQKPRAPEEEDEFAEMLSNVNVVYLGMKVLVLLDMSYMSRFWTQTEAWMAMHEPSKATVSEDTRRYTIVPLHNAGSSMVSALVDMWAGKNAQEAHEAIRPVDFGVEPSSLEGLLPRKEAQLYELIWRRAVASQMASARHEALSISLAAEGAGTARSSASRRVFEGFEAVLRPAGGEGGAGGG